MAGRCRCGSALQHIDEDLGCIQCGAACCPVCSYEIESAHYCSTCAEVLLDLPWAPATSPARDRAAVP